MVRQNRGDTPGETPGRHTEDIDLYAVGAQPAALTEARVTELIGASRRCSEQTTLEKLRKKPLLLGPNGVVDFRLSEANSGPNCIPSWYRALEFVVAGRKPCPDSYSHLWIQSSVLEARR